MYLAVIFLALGILFLIYLKWETSSLVRKVDKIPGPKKLPIIGNVHLLPFDTHGKHWNFYAKVMLNLLKFSCSFNFRFAAHSSREMAKVIRSNIPGMVWEAAVCRHIVSFLNGGTHPVFFLKCVRNF